MGVTTGRLIQRHLWSIYRAYDRDPAFADLRRGGKRVCPGRGSMRPEVVFVGEAPGRAEAATRKPFMGAAGQVLNALLDSVGMDRRNVFITNVVKYRPTIGEVTVRNRTPRPDEISASRPYLLAELAVFDGVPVVCLGNTPLRTLLRPDGPEHKSRVGDWHGHAWWHDDRQYMSLYHPAVGVYDKAMMPVLFADMLLMKEWLLS